ncbi:inactive transglutaminase family protein [Methylococcus sp. EFPC2]|uniref:inactive transglutaminase family protein n=1 Tax=Methylococcus sp. EFPC2 TaxID=2812648 RepID=UPI0019688C91|nr:inactive transglutaminase family protein [Methylococcus sp. EFPC2]QSA96864.1 inactive transglutaminase family protein [Methylococcus sp. EFPC2]
MKNLHLKILALLLVLIGVGLCYYKVTRLGLPLLPTEQADVWTLEARIEFKARKDVPVKVQFFIPRQPAGYTVVDENFVSSSYGLTTEDDGVRRSAQWAARSANGYQVLYYRLHLAKDPSTPPPPAEAYPIKLETPDYPELLRPAVTAVIEEARSKSADPLSFGREILLRLNSGVADANVSLLRQDIQSPSEWAKRQIYVLAGANIPARLLHVLQLRDGVKHGELTPWLEIHDGHAWQAVNPQTAELGLPHDAVVWHVGTGPVLSVSGGRFGNAEYSVTRHAQEMTSVAEQRARQMGSRLMEFSLFGLPVQTQNVYRVLLLVPLGAFLIVLLRNVVGFKSFGTFMPILIALAFRETKIWWGLALFSLVVALGLMIRFYLEYLKLLLVPRLAAVLIIVIMLMATVSLLSHKLGVDRGVSVALFPMVILAMTVERMSLVWEESGPWEALQQGVGSLLVASLGYLVMSSSLLGHLVFVFPELLLVVLAATLLLGRYTGYRLTELWRFRSALRE